ncbi:EAL domain-containing protein [Shewanella intestini]|uniref:EAL domain-containing protein n=1 Tax=Shewanella intestini TaxID=2017544 RepID=A0ABS5I126_9GAMM|nr:MULTISPECIES: EAL domain-containing protein [Shewanella]MBR9727729.1 EAL domain-containing protein [Shewanella intestini]MRG35121.1 EAL domain-containing protein [Shewanella sp. XMDDZSB0408]
MVNSTPQLLKNVLSDGILKDDDTSTATFIDDALAQVCQQVKCDAVFIITSQQDNLFAPSLAVVDTAVRQVASFFSNEQQCQSLFTQGLQSNQPLVDALSDNEHNLEFIAAQLDSFYAATPTAKDILSLLPQLMTPFLKWNNVNIVATITVGNVKVMLGCLYIHSHPLASEQQEELDGRRYYLEDVSFQIASAIELKRVSKLLDNKEKQYQELFQQLPMACGLLDNNDCIVMQNQVANQSLPIVVGQSLFSIIPVDDHALLSDTLHIVRVGLLRQAFCEVPLQLGLNKHWYKFSFCHALNAQNQLLLMIEDVTERYQLADELSFHSNHDALTGLPNRLQFEALLEEVLSDDESIQACVAFLDLDQFQVINDLSGHQAGDQLLQQVAKRLKQLLRKGDVVARLGGDEFGLLMYYSDEESAKQVAKRICHQLFEHEFIWNKVKHNVSASIGLAKIEADATDIYQVMSQADAACRLAKEEGRNRWHYFCSQDPQMHTLYNQMVASVDITGALALNQFELFYQLIEPLEKPETGVHLEILLRMVQEDGTFVSPGVFLPAAERYNLASRVDRWVIDNLLKWGAENLKTWSELSMVSVNLSATSLADQKFMSWLEMRLMVEPELVDKLCFEITETAAVSQLQQATALIDLLKPLGCKLALDDFGSGFSSFAYLKCLDVDFVKIDGQFVVNLCSDKSDEAIINAICQLGKDMNFEVIAEFVESIEIGHKLRHLGVHYGQGYAINKPSPLTGLISGCRQPWLVRKENNYLGGDI